MESNKDMVMSWVSNARGAEYGFLGAVCYALEQFEKKNNKPMYALIAFTNGKKFGSYKIDEGYKLTQFATPLRRVLQHALSDVKFVFKDGKAGVKVGKNGGVNSDVLRNLQALLKLHNGRVGLKSDMFKDMFPAVKSEPKQREDKSVVEQIVKLAKKQGLDRDKLEGMLMALWNEVEVAK